MAAVRVTRLELAYTSDDREFGELRAHFDRATWDTERDGLIYTDRSFEAVVRELTSSLLDAQLPAASLHYSEAGMQGDGFVSFDVRGDLIKAWDRSQA
jgi:hypothetical protein